MFKIAGFGVIVGYFFGLYLLRVRSLAVCSIATLAIRHRFITIYNRLKAPLIAGFFVYLGICKSIQVCFFLCFRGNFGVISR
jgi:hypothetical protein